MILQRSILAVPATSPHFFEKAARSKADSVFLDLEDAVAIDKKIAARHAAIEALNDIDWQSKNVVVRVNELASQWGLKDIIEIVEKCSRLDALLIPKVGNAEEIKFVDRLLNSLEAGLNRKHVAVDALIETPSGVSNVEQIAACSSRLRSLSFGVGDYSVAMQVPQANYGSPDPNYAILTDPGDEGVRLTHWGDQWHYALARIANACRAHGVQPIDGPFTDIADEDGYRACAYRSRSLGYEGKWAIHPSQIAHANEIFAPSECEFNWAKKIVSALEQANSGGAGAVQVDGKMLDLAHVKQAKKLISNYRLATGRD